MVRNTHHHSVDDDHYSDYSEGSKRYSESVRSGRSYHSYSTAPTEYGYGGLRRESCRSELVEDPDSQKHHEAEERSFGWVPSTEDMLANAGPRTSVETYASTIPSLEDLDESVPEHEIQQPRSRFTDALPCTPSDFAELFPSTRTLHIAHDDSTSDGNMNLRIDTRVRTAKGRELKMTLFHLRMYDLKNREFSLRRYGRDSGREVCHTGRTNQRSAVDHRPGLQRSLSNALAVLRPRSDSRTTTMSTLKRMDSGYESLHGGENVRSITRPSSSSSLSSSHKSASSNTTKLEFANYAQLGIKRRGTKSSKRYEFDYWGDSYQWKRVVGQGTSESGVSYHLLSSKSDVALAQIVPQALDPVQQSQERSKGGWIPPCSMRITEEGMDYMRNDVPDVVVASGLIALVDDCIIRRFQCKRPRKIAIPVPKPIADADIGEPKTLVSDMFSRPSTSHSTSSTRPSPLRHMSARR